MATENVRLELVKAFIIAGTPVEEIPAKVELLEAFVPPAWAVTAGVDYARLQQQVQQPGTQPFAAGHQN